MRGRSPSRCPSAWPPRPAPGLGVRRRADRRPPRPHLHRHRPRRTRRKGNRMTAAVVPAANDAAAACQRLRGHLAYLKLGAAAEALPAVLDAARDQDLTVLAALEQLLGTEAAAAEARKLASRLHWAALPAPWTLADYDFSAQPGADEKS